MTMGRLRDSEDGFTLVELMVVVLIIGILVSIAVPVYLSASASAQSKSCQANQRTISGAAAMYADTGGSVSGASFADGSRANRLVPVTVRTTSLRSRGISPATTEQMPTSRWGIGSSSPFAFGPIRATLLLDSAPSSSSQTQLSSHHAEIGAVAWLEPPVSTPASPQSS
jgi:prepilin-type N-terminal cleavage/methylation domain-containing protein